MARRQSSEPKQRKVALAFAGPGDSTFENTADLLDDFLGIKDGEVPDDDVLDLELAFPVTKAHLSSGLKSVVKWTDEYELAYDAIESINEVPSKTTGDVSNNAEKITQAKNVEKALIDWLHERQEDGYEARLILLWGEEGDEASETLLDLATSFDIKALDLTAGLDDISFGEGEDEEEEAAPEPEPEPEKPATRSRRRRGAEPAPEPEAKTDDPPWSEESVEEANAKSPAPRRSRAKKAEEIPPTPEGEETLQETLARVKDAVADEAQELAQRGSTRTSDFTDLADPEDLIAQFIGVLLSLPDAPEISQALYRAREAQMWLRYGLASALVKNEAASEESPSAPQEPEEAPKRGRGRPRSRTAAERAVTEYYDEDDKQWVRAGRGRLPKDVKTRKVDPDTGKVIE